MSIGIAAPARNGVQDALPVINYRKGKDTPDPALTKRSWRSAEKSLLIFVTVIKRCACDRERDFKADDQGKVHMQCGSPQIRTLENDVQQMDLAFRLVMFTGVGIRLKVVWMRVNDNPAISGFMLMHKDRAAAHNQAKKNCLKQG
jgi:hypothetical protein